MSLLSLSFHVSLFTSLSLQISSQCICVCCVLLCVVRFFLSGTEKRSRVYVQNAPVCTFKTPASHWTRAFSKYTRKRFERSHGSVLNVHTGESLSPRVSLLSYVSFFLSRSLSARLSLSLVGSLCLFSITMTMIASPVGSLCTHGPSCPEYQSARALAHSLLGEHVRIMQETIV